MSDLNSLILYIIIFLLSVLLMFVAQYNMENNRVYRILVLISILIPSLLAGLRYNVGSDFENYINIFKRIKNTSFLDFIETNNYEVAFFILQKVAALLGSVQWLLFLSSFIMLIFIYLSLKQYRNKISISLVYFLYIFMIFPTSLNIIRQQIAVAIIVFSFKYIFEKQLLRFIMFCILASTFHITALVVIPTYFLFNYKQYTLSIKDNRKVLLRGSFLLFAFIFVINFDYFLTLATRLSGIDRFEYYTQEIDMGNNKEFFLKAFILIPILFLKNKLIKYDNRNKLFIYFLLIDFVLTLVGFWNPFVKRIAIYFGITQIFLLPSIVVILKTKIDRYLTRWLVCLYAIIYFILAFYILGQANIIPYSIN